jgi:hypothetical protein
MTIFEIGRYQDTAPEDILLMWRVRSELRELAKHDPALAWTFDIEHIRGVVVHLTWHRLVISKIVPFVQILAADFPILWTVVNGMKYELEQAQEKGISC